MTTVVATTAFIAGFEHFFLVAHSATPGKLILGIYVGTLDGRAISHIQAVIRYVAVGFFFADYWLPGAAGFLAFCLLIVSFAMARTDPQKRALHDRIAGTRVLVGRPIKPPAIEASAFPRL